MLYSLFSKQIALHVYTSISLSFRILSCLAQSSSSVYSYKRENRVVVLVKKLSPGLTSTFHEIEEYSKSPTCE